MKAGRKNLKRAAAEEHSLSLQDGECIMQVLSLRGSNLIEVMDSNEVKSLALFPAKFQKSMWIKKGSFVVVDRGGMEKTTESGSKDKVTCIVSRVLFHEHVRTLQKSPEWPEIFRSTTVEDDTKGSSDAKALNHEEADGLNSSDEDDDDGLPPLEANMNRVEPRCVEADDDSDTESDSDS